VAILTVPLLVGTGCGSRPRARIAPVASSAASPRPPSPTPTVVHEPAPADSHVDASPTPLAGPFYAHVHAPGAEPKVHVNVSLTEWTLTGCISEVQGACDKSGSFVVGPAGRAELLRIWKDVRATPRCEPEGRWPGDRFFEITHGDETFAGRLPASDADLPTRNAGPCRAGARLAMWFVHQFRDRPQ
jgi:hypothetical protein